VMHGHFEFTCRNVNKNQICHKLLVVRFAIRRVV
jgi:hypothetical protein